MFSGILTRFPQRRVSGLQLSHYTKETEFTLSILTNHAIQKVLPIKYIVEVNHTSTSIKIVSDSCYTLLNSDLWNRLGRPVLRRGPILKYISQNLIPVLGIADIEVRLNGQSKKNPRRLSRST